MPDEWFDHTGSAEIVEVPTLPRNLFDAIATSFNIDLMSSNEFINVDNQIECSAVMNDTEILDVVNDEVSTDEVDCDDVHAQEQPAKPPTSTQARQALETLSKFFESNPHSIESDMTSINSMILRVNELSIKSSSQMSITSFLKK